MGVSRRRLLQAGGSAAALAAVGVPAVQHFSWGGKDFVREGYTPDLPDAPPGEQAWMNWSGIVRATPRQIGYPSSEEEVAEVVGTTPLRIRPVGSGHSNTGLAPSEGAMLDISALEGLYAYDAQTGRATFGAGTRLFQAASELAERGRAFANLPDIDVQTLAGSFSTATHGTGNALTALHDYIVGFRIVSASGDIWEVSEARDPDLFAAGKVSLGALGIITQYTVETVPAFNLRRRVWIEPVGPFLDRVEELGETHRNFEFFYSPGTGYVAAVSHDRHEGPVTGKADSEDDDFLASLKELRDTFGWWPWIRRRIAQSAFPTGTIEDVSDESWRLLSTTRPTKFNEMEYHLPRDEGVKTVRTVIDMLDRHKDAFFPIEYRHIAPDAAWLSPFNGGPCASIAIHAAVDEPYRYFFTDFEPVFRAAGGRPHWGKLHSLGKAELSALYPDYERFLALRREMDPAGKFLNPHLAILFGEAADV